MRNRIITALVAASMALCIGAAAAQDASVNDFGAVGLMQTPSARMSEDGTFKAGLSIVRPYNQLLLGVQLFPWLETQFRYIEVDNRLYGPVEFSGNQTYKDRGIDFKLRLMDEGAYRPALALGMMDIGGTGLFSSEYLVASRRYYDLDWSIGIGWGRLGARGDIDNPLAVLSSRFDDRGITEIGDVGINRVFRGRQVSIFGGVQWQTPFPGVSLKFEYDGNDYRSEAMDNDQPVHFPINAAVNWRLWDSMDLAMGIERGDTIMFRWSAFTNFNDQRGPAKVLDPPPSSSTLPRAAVEAAPVPREQPVAVDEALLTALRTELGRQRITLVALDASQDRRAITLWYAQNFAQDPHYALGRAGQTLALMMPPGYEAFTMVNVIGESETFRVTLPRQQIDKLIDLTGSAEEARASALIDLPQPPSAMKQAAFGDYIRYPGFFWGMGPALRQHVGGPDDFYFGQVWWRVNGTVVLSPRWSMSTTLGANLYNNFDGLKVRDTSTLPEVRSNVVQYLKEGENNLVKLETNYVWSPATNLSTRLSAGIFEEMYGGVAGEVLYAKPYSRWAVGVDGAWVRKRDFDQRFGFQDYETFTGHVTAYIDLPFGNLHMNVSAGRYLAKDVGATLEMSRRFDSGVVAGAFATKTDVSAADFGEGKFDKGLFLYLPLDLFFARSTRRSTNLVFRPLTRDGGQKVRNGVPLYGLYEAGRFDPDADWAQITH